MANQVIANSKMLLVITLFFTATHCYSQSSTCQAELKVVKNRNTKSVSSEGATYLMEITNNGTTKTTYTLNSLNINSTCSNNDGSSTSGNVNLLVLIADSNLTPINEISLNPGELATFLVNVNIPDGTTLNKWNCTQIIATATSCSNYSINTILHTLVSDPNQE